MLITFDRISKVKSKFIFINSQTKNIHRPALTYTLLCYITSLIFSLCSSHPIFSSISWSCHVSLYLYDFAFTTEFALMPLLQSFPGSGSSKETFLISNEPVEMSLHTVKTVLFSITRKLNYLLCLKVLCPFNYIVVITLHDCLYISAPYEPLQRRIFVLFIFASWSTKHVNNSYCYIHKSL